ncbi:MAG TPA: PadR family transcriptional regulator [Candidatus Angelobacter sp.]|nr:PadR family transcriptional regulator [Candidatus Angelobacter sp.]
MAKNDQLLGSLDLLVLKTLAQLGSMHGYGIVLHIQQVSDDLLRIEEGSLYPALHRIEEAGWITSEWRISENNRRAKYYQLTARGRKQLAVEQQSWERVVKGVNSLLKFA